MAKQKIENSEASRKSWSDFVGGVQKIASKSDDFVSMYSITAVRTGKKDDMEYAKKYVDEQRVRQEMKDEVINLARQFYWLAHDGE